jgi:hypothetical protein
VKVYPIRHAKHKSNLTMTFECLINFELNCNSTIDIYSTLKPDDTQQRSRPHRLTFRPNRITFENVTSK